MKTTLLSLLCILVFFACASVRIADHNLGTEVKRYQSILLLFTDSEEDFFGWDKENYQYVINGRFNNLEGSFLRKELSDRIGRHLSPARTIAADQYFRVQQLVSYEDFMSQVNQSGADAMLVVNLRDFYITQETVDGNLHNRPNAHYHCFLIDNERLENVWMANISVHGEYLAGNNTLYNKLSSSIARSLRQAGYLGSH